MPLTITNSLTKKKEEFIPLEDKIVRMYSCGVTVYDKCHIGHARSLYIFDVIRRYLCFRGYDVRFVRNITDVDDKIINRARELNRTSGDLSKEYISYYEKDLELLGVAKADKEPRATDQENIDAMIAMITSLIDQGTAYEIDGDVYFSVRGFSEYGKLSGQSIDHMQEAVRIEQDDQKRDPLDFALWKRSAEGEPFWDSPWGKGRPGWHIECSCMSLKHLDCETLDIHAGGRDLIFPHHENEIAQAEGATHKTFAKYWIHHGLLTINGQKMSKSLGNFITIEEAVEKFEVDDLKFFFLSAHYGSPIDFTGEKIAEAHKALQKIRSLFQRAEDLGAQIVSDIEWSRLEGATFIRGREREFLEAMDDDFNTPKGMACLFDLVNDTNRYLDTCTDDSMAAMVSGAAVSVIRHLCRDIFGLFTAPEKAPELAAGLQQILDERAAARSNKDFQRSDELRDLLLKKGIVVEDTPQGQRWRKG